jgi:hypothetical protein
MKYDPEQFDIHLFSNEELETICSTLYIIHHVNFKIITENQLSVLLSNTELKVYAFGVCFNNNVIPINWDDFITIRDQYNISKKQIEIINKYKFTAETYKNLITQEAINYFDLVSI